MLVYKFIANVVKGGQKCIFLYIPQPVWQTLKDGEAQNNAIIFQLDCSLLRMLP